MRLSAVAAIVVLAIFAVAAMAQPAPAPRGPGTRRVTVSRPTPQEQFEQIAARVGLTDKEKTVCRAAIREKMQAAQTLNQDMDVLGQLVRKKGATDEQLNAAFKQYDTTLAAYRDHIKQIDSELVPKLSPRARVAMMIVGVLDNGLRALGGSGAIGITGLLGGGRTMRMRGGARAPVPAPAPAK